MDADKPVADALVAVLNACGHEAAPVGSGAELLTSHRDYDVVILDLNLPDMDGEHALRRFRMVSSAPVVVLTVNNDERTVVRALRLGADDYLVKPAPVGVLIARLENISRRRVSPTVLAPVMVVTRDVCVDLAAREVRVGGEPVALTPSEFRVVEILVEKPGSAVSRQQLRDRIWGDAFLALSRSLDVHVSTLRAKLNRPGLINTVRGYGYRWEV
ncbi:DNA-binding response OmpR family regulator [Nocardia mexicana]|uniref:Sensory transduction protein RegX3 n=1 Tax=Nocardia mexicana TaxID=279262 RepID=A0A370GT06_9NOCA|nr:DNA-binding response OmpR family regulator [Nocardia mexicana]